MSALLFAAISRSGMETSVALAADHLVAIVFLSQNTEGRFDNT